MLSEENILNFVKNFEKTQESHPESLQVFKINEKIFLIIHKNTTPLRIDVKCDKKLAKLLTSRYETVMPSQLLGNTGIELVLTGQLPESEIQDLIFHSYHTTKLAQTS